MAAKGSTQQAQKSEPAAPPPRKGKKRLLIVLALLLLLGGGGGGAAWWYLHNKAQHEAELAQADQDDEADEQAGNAGADGARQPSRAARGEVAPRVFVRLDPFTTNLADEGGDRVAQIIVNVELRDAKAQEELSRVLPVVRNRILYLISSHESASLLTIAGKNQLAQDIALRTGLAIGWRSPEPVDEIRDPLKVPVSATGSAAAQATTQTAMLPAAQSASQSTVQPAAQPAARVSPKSRRRPEPNPVVAVHFEQFIVQ